jgi:methylmalonyl-CoA mutase C-terminal domain/subunit
MNTRTRNRPLQGKRILIGKPGLDGHDIGAKIIALTLRNAGAEVIYTGLRRSPGQIARVAVDEGVDALGLSILSGSHKELVNDVFAELRGSMRPTSRSSSAARFRSTTSRNCARSASRGCTRPTCR